ncbi:MAG TPA: type II secretion system protein [Phycisphaerae bacterium]|nr:type II secretion system protein [Phycisphaerae bacterium]
MAISGWPKASRAFTLIELLVVVAIIALLVSILLPSLATAREQAKTAVCLSRLKNLGNAEKAYEAENRGFLAGSPLTTGYHLAHYQPNLGLSSGNWKPGLPVNMFDYSIPLLRQMNIALPKVGATVAPYAPPQYHLLTTSGPMECPSNLQMAIAYNSGGSIPPNAPQVKATSYLTMSGIVRGGPAVYSQYTKGSPPLMGSANPSDMGQSSSWQVVVPSSYLPQVEKVGQASIKVFLADGLRYLNENSSQITYNLDLRATYGYQCAQPPCDIKGTSTLAREYNLARKYSYRHANKKGINALMLDGHAETLRAEFKSDQRATGPAVHPKYYFPTGSRVNDKTNMLLQDQLPKTPFVLP